jgi:hypothetical protein
MVALDHHCRQFTPFELNAMRFTADFAMHPAPKLAEFYVKYMERKNKDEHFADWSARFPYPEMQSLEIVAVQQGVIVTSVLTYEDEEYELYIPRTCKNGDMDVCTSSWKNLFLFLDTFFPLIKEP